MVTLKVRTLDGDITELPVESSDYVYSVAQRLAQLKKPSEKVFARLVKDGQPLAPGSQVGDCEGVVDAIWCKWMPPEEFRNSSKEVLPRRERGELKVDEGCLDISGVFARQGYDRSQLAIELPYKDFSSLRILDVRQCGFAPHSLLMIFDKLPTALEELRASRNHFTLPVLQCLQKKALQLRVVDLGYSECNRWTPLPDLVCEKTEELVLGDSNNLDVDSFTHALSKCPSLRFLDICMCFRVAAGFEQLANCRELRKLDVRRVDVQEEKLKLVLSSCTQLEHLYLNEIASSGTVQLLATLPNLKVLASQVATAKGNQLLCEICELQVETLLIFPAVGGEDEEDEAEPSTALSENIQPLVEALKTCSAGCIALDAPSVDPMILEAVGCRLCTIGNGLSSARYSLLSSLVEMKHCCANLLSLDVNYYEQIDDDCDFQLHPIDEGILALGEHCHQLEHLDMYDRILQEPAKTLIQASKGWPKLRYLCMANCTRKEWTEVAEMDQLPEALATNCPKLQEFVIYDQDMRKLFEPVLMRQCPLYGELLEYDSDSDDSGDEGDDGDDGNGDDS